MRRNDELKGALAAVAAGMVAGSVESETLEFKEPKPGGHQDTIRDLLDAVICLTNARGGVVCCGVADKAGRAAFVGCDLDPRLVQRRIYELSVPALTVDAETVDHAGVPLLVIHVPASPEVHGDTRGRALRRVGTDCLPMSPIEVARVRDERLGIDWSARVGDRTIADVQPAALTLARTRLAAFTGDRGTLARLDEADLLRALGVTDAAGQHLTVAGELLFCSSSSHDPAVVYSYRQTPGGEPRLVERLETPLLLALDRVMDRVQARQNVTPISLPGGQQIPIEDFPELAVREAVVNAVMHRDYHLQGPVVVDHSPEVFTVTSPGPLVSGITPENILTHPSKPRNRNLSSAIRLLGLAEEIGRGVDRMYREMIRSGRETPRIENHADSVRVVLVGGAPKTQVARYVAQLPETARDDTDTLLVLYRLCRTRTVTATEMAPLLQKTAEETEVALRRLTSDPVAVIEPTRETARRSRPAYRLRAEVLQALGAAVAYQRRTMDDIDRKVVAHVREYDTITNRTVQNLFDVGVQRARAILADLVERRVLKKTSQHERGPGVEYGRGTRFPAAKRRTGGRR